MRDEILANGLPNENQSPNKATVLDGYSIVHGESLRWSHLFGQVGGLVKVYSAA